MNTLRRLFLTMLAVLSVSLSVSGQESDVITLYGHVIDSGTAESLFFSSIGLSGTRITNVSNSDGMFSLKIPAGTSPETEVQISHLGYMTRSVTVGSFSGRTLDDPLEIPLFPVAIQLDPATVRSIDPEILFKSAFYKVRDNYPVTRMGMTAFYREMVRKGTAKYLVLNEAVIDIDKGSYIGIQSDRVGIFKGRGSTNYDTTDTLFVKLQGGINTALELDMVRYPFLGFALDEVTDKYVLSMGGVESSDGHSFYVLNFEPAPKATEILFRGKIFIEVESLAIGRVEFSMAVEGREEEASHLFVLKHPSNTRFYVNSAEYVINYRCFDDVWYYDYCRADISFSTRRVHSIFRNNFSVTEEMAVTDHKEGGIAILPAERVKFRDILSDKVADFADDSFWEDYNIIEPDQTIDVLIRRIIRQLNRRGE